MKRILEHFFNNRSLSSISSLLFCLLLFLFDSNSVAQNWQNLGPRGLSIGQSDQISMAISKAGIPYVGFTDDAFSHALMVMKFDGNSWVNIGPAGFTGNIGDAFFILDNNDTPYVAFEDYQSMSGTTVMKFDGGNWNVVGIRSFSLGNVKKLSLAFDRNNIPYVAFKDLSFGANNGRATVMFFDGTNWQNVGNPGFSSNDIGSIKLAIDTNNSPFVVTSDLNGAKVKKFDGSTWIDLDTGSISPGPVDFTTITFDDFNLPNIAYQDNSIQGRATVKKFDGLHWIDVGSPGISTGASEYTSVIFKHGFLYLSYIDNTSSLKATMKIFTGSTWNTVGNADFTPSNAYGLSPGIDTSGIAYVAFKDNIQSNKISVMYFNPTSGISNFNPYSLKHNIIFPNPNYGSFFFQSSEQSTFKLLNAAGQVIDKIVTKTSDLNCYTFSNLKPGIYFLVSPKLIYKSEKIIVLEK